MNLGMSSFGARPKWRLALAVACVGFPVMVYGLAFKWLANLSAPPAGLPPEAIGAAFLTRSGAVFAAELAARERFILTSALMFAVSVAVFVYALAILFRRRGARFGALATIAALVTGGAAAITGGNPLRLLTVDKPLTAAIEAKASFGLAAVEAGFATFVFVNTLIGIAAVGAVMLRFADLAAGMDDEAGDETAFANRSAALRETMLAASALLTSATVATYFYYHYPLALMTPAAQDVYRTLSGVASVRWGGIYTLILATASAPAIAAFFEARRRAAASGALAGADARIGWLSADALAQKAKIIAAVLGVLAPAMASPLLEFLKIGTG